MESIDIALILALIISVIIHEMAHGYAANYLGDPTARLQGRLSPNPLVHIDPMMSVILPALLIFSGSNFVFGAAKPVAFHIVALNIFLAVFNLVPLPPLDGSKIFPKFLPFSLQMKYEQFRNFMEQNVALAFGLVIVVFIVFLGGPLSDLTQTISFWLVS